MSDGAYDRYLRERQRLLAEENVRLKAERDRLETDLGQARQRIEAAKKYARLLQRLGTNDEGGIAQNVLLKLGVPFEETAAPQKAGQP